MQTIRVRDIMIGAVMAVGVDEPLSSVLHAFYAAPLHHLPVSDADGVVVGMLSSADMLKLEHFLPKHGTRLPDAVLNERFPIRRLMRTPPVTTPADQTLEEAAAQMVVHAVHALPVVDGKGRLLGIVTTSDIMHALIRGTGSGAEAAEDAGVRTATGAEPRRPPSEAEMLRASAAAEAATLKGADPDGIAAAMLYLQARNAKLEKLREDVARYVHAGQDEHLHTRLLRDLDALGEPGAAVML